MGLFGNKRKRQMKKLFQNCDFQFARKQIIENMSGGVYPKELTRLLDAYMTNPSPDNALDLIDFDSKFAAFFHNNRSTMSFMKNNGIDPMAIRKTKAMLEAELGFENLCMKFPDQDDGFRKMKESFISKGYSEEVISEAITDWFKDAAS